MKLFTVGYEGASLDEFMLALKKHHIRCIADLRKNPVSRKRGFSKKLLGEGLDAQGIAYIHLPGLGTPTEWRKQEKEGLLSRKKMFNNYVKKVLPQHPDDLRTLQKLMSRKGLALLCYEADASDCHRSFVAQELTRLEKGAVQTVNIQVLPLKIPHGNIKLFR